MQLLRTLTLRNDLPGSPFVESSVITLDVVNRFIKPNAPCLGEVGLVINIVHELLNPLVR
jgi:hypothetical protein